MLLVDETSIRWRYRYVTVILNGETGQILAMVEHRLTAAPGRLFSRTEPKTAARCRCSRHQRIPSLQGSYRHLPGSRPPRPGPLPRHPLVRCRSHRRAPRYPTPTRRHHPGLLPRRVPSTVRSPTERRPTHREPGRPHPTTPQRPSPATDWLGRPTRTLRPLPCRRLRRRPPSTTQIRGSPHHRRTPRDPPSRRHRPRLERRNPRLAPMRATIKRTPRRRQQPPPWSYKESPTASPTPTTTPPADSF